MAGLGPFVIAGDRRPARAGLVAGNVASLGLVNVATVVADGRQPPLRAGSIDRVLIDAPCSGLGVLRRRPDARWRIRPDDVVDLADLQRALLGAAGALLVPGGTLVYSVCTMTAAETVDIDRWLAGAHPELEAGTVPGLPWVGRGRGAQLLPQTVGTDGMFILILRRRP
jgi:16S rRNA (cytosine967-C5)-methyltransferase